MARGGGIYTPSSHHSQAMNLEFTNHRVVLILECPNHRVVRQALTTQGRPRVARGGGQISTLINKLQPLRNGMQQIFGNLTFTRRF